MQSAARVALLASLIALAAATPQGESPPRTPAPRPQADVSGRGCGARARWRWRWRSQACCSRRPRIRPWRSSSPTTTRSAVSPASGEGPAQRLLAIGGAHACDVAAPGLTSTPRRPRPARALAAPTRARPAARPPVASAGRKRCEARCWTIAGSASTTALHTCAACTGHRRAERRGRVCRHHLEQQRHAGRHAGCVRRHRDYHDRAC
jgi:hypothetical protein